MADRDPADVVECRECGSLVRRVNNQHLQSARCAFVGGEAGRDDKARPDHPETTEEYLDKYPDAPVVSPREREQQAEAHRDPEIDRRRREMVRRRWRGDDPGEITRDLADRHGVAESTLRADWARRSEWLARVFGVDDLQAIAVAALAEKREFREDFRRYAQRASDAGDLATATRATAKADNNINEFIELIVGFVDGDGPAAGAMGLDDPEPAGGAGAAGGAEPEPPGAGLGTDTIERLDGITGGGDAVVVESEPADATPAAEGGDD